jgi:hypothetical protein
MEAYLDWQSKSAGIKLNDVIEEYRYVAAGKQIKAGDLVNYINGAAGGTDYGESVDTQLSTETYTGYTISAVQLDENRVFVAHSHKSSWLYLYGMICTIKGSTITYGDNIQLSTTRYSGYRIALVKLDSNRVFIAHGQDQTNHYLYGMLVTIDGTTITKDTDTQLSTIAFSGAYISAELLPNGNIFIAHDYDSSNRYLFGMVVTIDGNTIIAGTDTVISSSTKTGVTISTCLLPNGNVFIAHSYGSDYYLYGIVCSISGTTITAGSDTVISTINSSGGNSYMSVLTLSDGNVFIAHRGENIYLYGMICTIDGTTITKGTDTLISSATQAGTYISTYLLPNGNVFIAHRGDNLNELNGMVCSIEGATIKAYTDTLLISGEAVSSVVPPTLLIGECIFIAHNNSLSYYLNAQLFVLDNNIPTNNIVVTEYEQQVTPAIEPPFDAIALSSGVGGTEFVEGEVTKTGNLFGDKTWNKVSMYEYTTDDGSTITINADTEVDCELYKAFDGVSDYTHRCFPKIGGSIDTSPNVLLTYEFTNPTKITKMLLSIAVATTHFVSAMIQGSKDNNEWVDLSNVPNTNSQTMYEYSLNNVDYYKYYRLSFHLTIASNQSSGFSIVEWQTSEYIVKEQIPSTEHNEQVKIARVYKEVEVEKTVEGNIFPTSWNEESTTKIVASDGTILTASSYNGDSYKLIYACDGNTGSLWKAGATGTSWLKIKLPKTQKITKMKSYIQPNTGSINVIIQGSNDDDTWDNLYTISEKQTALTEITLNNPNYYQYYKLLLECSSSGIPHVYEWQTSEYIEKVTEVIQ